MPWFCWPTPPSDLNNIGCSSVPSLPQLFLHFPHRHAHPAFPHCCVFLTLFPCIVVLFPCFSCFPHFPITRSHHTFRALPSVSWFLIYLGGSPGHITCCPLNFRVLNPPLHVIPFPLFLRVPPVPSIYIDCIR